MATGERLVKVAEGTWWNARAGKSPLVFFHPLVGGELDLVTAALELLGQGGSGEEMAARASRGEKDRARAHAARSLTRSDSACGSASAFRFRCPAIGRLRVSPSAKPMVSAMAISEEPP